MVPVVNIGVEGEEEDATLDAEDATRHHSQGGHRLDLEAHDLSQHYRPDQHERQRTAEPKRLCPANYTHSSDYSCEYSSSLVESA